MFKLLPIQGIYTTWFSPHKKTKIHIFLNPVKAPLIVVQGLLIYTPNASCNMIEQST